MTNLKEALGWQELSREQTIILVHMGSVKLVKALMPQSVKLSSVIYPDAPTIDNAVSWDHLATLYQAVTSSLCLRALKFKQMSLESDIMRVGFFHAPGCVEYLLNQKIPFCCSMQIAASWHKNVTHTVRHSRFFKVCVDLLVNTSDTLY